MNGAGFSAQGDVRLPSGQALTVERIFTGSDGTAVDLTGRSFTLTFFAVSGSLAPVAVDAVVAGSIASFSISSATMVALYAAQTKGAVVQWQIVEHLSGDDADFVFGPRSFALVAAGPTTAGGQQIASLASAPIAQIIGPVGSAILQIDTLGGPGFSATQVLKRARPTELADTSDDAFAAYIDAKVLAAAQGAIDLTALQGAAAAAAASDVAEIKAGAIEAAATMRALIQNFITGNGDAAVPNFTYQQKGFLVTDESQLIYPGDLYLLRVTVQAMNPAVDIAINFSGGSADFDDGSSTILYAGDVAAYDWIGTSAISIIGRWNDGRTTALSVALFFQVARSVAKIPPVVTVGDRAVAAWPDEVDTRFSVAVATAINALDAAGLWKTAVRELRFAGPTQANNAINLANPSQVATFSTGCTFDPYGYMAGDGANGGIDLNATGASLGMISTDTAASYMHFVKPFDTRTSTVGATAGNSASALLQANYSATTARVRSGGGTDTVAVPAGKMLTVSRMDNASYMVFADDQLVATTQRAFPAITDHDLRIGATGGTPFSSASSMPVMAHGYGPGMTADVQKQIFAAIAPVFAVQAAIHAELNP